MLIWTVDSRFDGQNNIFFKSKAKSARQLHIAQHYQATSSRKSDNTAARQLVCAVDQLRNRPFWSMLTLHLNKFQ